MRISDWSSDVCSSDLLIHRYQFLKTDGGSWRRCHASSLSGNPAFPLSLFICSLPRKGEISLSVHRLAGPQLAVPHQRSEERRVGKECVSTCRSRWSRYH